MVSTQFPGLRSVRIGVTTCIHTPAWVLTSLCKLLPRHYLRLTYQWRDRPDGCQHSFSDCQYDSVLEIFETQGWGNASSRHHSGNLPLLLDSDKLIDDVRELLDDQSVPEKTVKLHYMRRSYGLIRTISGELKIERNTHGPP